MHGTGTPSAWVTRFAHLLRPGGTVLDLACGGGRHLRWLAAQGHRVTGVDRDAASLEPLRTVGEVLVADIENGPWPLAHRQFDGVVVTNYLWRNLFPQIRASLAPGGVLVYETFADGHQHIGRPSRPDFLLQRGELLRAFADLRVVAFEDGFDPGTESGTPRCVQRLVAVLESPDAAAPERWGLAGPAR